jgi:RimJ/RimL family protein N-acetyltransferase
MRINQKEFNIRKLRYVIRTAEERDANSLSELRLLIDGETENLDREKGEAYIDQLGFKEIIKEDATRVNHLFLVAEVNDRLVGFSRCEGSKLKRTAHRVEFGVCVLREFWGHAIGKNLLHQSIIWADSANIKKMTLNVLETNAKAIQLYKSFGFEIEGVLKKDKLLSDGKYYDTVLMGRVK